VQEWGLLVIKKNVVTKRDDPNFAQVSGYIPKEKALEFKVICTRRQISQSEALEEAVDKWLEQNEPTATASTKKKEG
jgi:hypothetical protein